MADASDSTLLRRLRAAVDSAPSGLLMVDDRGVIVLANREIERLFGYARGELVGQRVELLVPDHARGLHVNQRHAYAEAPAERPMGHGRNLTGRRKDGSEVAIEIGLSSVPTDEGAYVLAAVVDITARQEAEDLRRRLEAELRQAQKMEALGLLAGGFAHDFNNILGAIVGYAELVRERVLDDPTACADLDRVLLATRKGKDIVNRVLRYTRRQRSARETLDLAVPVDDAVALLRGSLPRSITLAVDIAGEAPLVMADATAVHQILLNLGTNALQAMPHGGHLTIRLEPFYARDSVARNHPDLREGPYACLTVRDSGTGMTADVLARACDPFYTTKEPGQGTGLGLAMVRTLMRDHAGAVAIESAPGQGTAVRCYFPACEQAAEPIMASDALAMAATGMGRRIFYVDDEVALAEVGVRRLNPYGYAGRAFSDPARALAAIEADPAAVDLLITDQTMPGITGLDLVRAVRRLRPDLPVIMLTGWIDHLQPDQVAAAGVNRLLIKPVTGKELVTAVRTVLETGGEEKDLAAGM